MLVNFGLIEKMLEPNLADLSQDTPYASCRRMACCAILVTTQYAINQSRLKKPFNPILGETYEQVTDKYRFFSEQVSHHPPITAFHFEGEGIEMESYSHLIQSFKFGGGAGSLHYNQSKSGIWDFKLPKYNDQIKLSKMNI